MIIRRFNCFFPAMKRVPRGNSEQSHETSTKIDLSKFKKTPRSKLTSTAHESLKKLSESSSKASKRQYVTMEPNEEGSSSSKMNKKGPENWEIVWANIKEMRKNLSAPVDSMGCDKCPDKSANPEVTRYQSLLSLMLSSQTKDQITHAAMTKLIEHGCTVPKILETSDAKLGELIYPVSFWKNKVKHIKKTTEILHSQYNDDIPKTVDELCKLPGVGPKMAHLCMQSAWNEVTGIGVDTHVHKISNRLGWVKTKTPEATRKALEDWVPKEMWKDLGLMLVGFGQQTCKSVRPLCGECANKSLCPFGKSQKNK